MRLRINWKKGSDKHAGNGARVAVTTPLQSTHGVPVYHPAPLVKCTLTKNVTAQKEEHSLQAEDAKNVVTHKAQIRQFMSGSHKVARPSKM